MSRAELDARIADGSVRADTLVWRVGLAAWQEASTVADLGFPPPVPPPPLPPPLEPVPNPAMARDEAQLREWAAQRERERAEKEWAEARGASAPEYAGFGVRLAAKVVDICILTCISLVVERVVAALWFGGVVPPPPAWGESWAEWLRLLSITAPINLALALAYSVYFILRHEATPGKRMLGLRLVRADGSRVKGGRVIGRYFAEQISGLLFCVGYVMAAFDEEKRTLHDYMCDTRVVKGSREEEA